MIRQIFPYGIVFRETGRVEVFPAVELSVIGRGGATIRALFHLDSGATVCVLPASDAKVLNIDLRKGRRIILRGITGQTVAGFEHSITLKFGALELEVPVVFGSREIVPRILGRRGVFEKFAIVFDEAQRRTAFLERSAEQRTIENLFLE